MKNKLTIYLGGSIEMAKDLGVGWRESITPFLEDLGLEVLDPTLLEFGQFKGLRPKRLPDSLETRKGETISPTYWHDLKHAKDERLQKRFLKYIRRIIKFDMGVVRNEADYLLCYWDNATARGAGTHAEITEAFLHNKPVYIVEKAELPAWIRGCATKVFSNFKDAQEFLSEEFED